MKGWSPGFSKLACVPGAGRDSDVVNGGCGLQTLVRVYLCLKIKLNCYLLFIFIMDPH
jgi:hypothetical protein